MSVATDTDTPAGLGRRLAALGYDLLVLLAVWFLAATPVVLVSGPPDTPIGRLLFRLYLVAVTVWFLVWFWTHGGQTVGMRAWRLQLVAADGGPVTRAQALKRAAAAPLSWLTLGLGYAWSWLDPQRRSWHDRLSGTRVVLRQQTH